MFAFRDTPQLVMIGLLVLVMVPGCSSEEEPDETGESGDSDSAQVSTLFADELDEVELPDVGKAVFVRGDYEFEMSIQECTLEEDKHDGRQDIFSLLARVEEGGQTTSAIVSRELWLTPQDYERSSIRHEDDTVMVQARPESSLEDAAWLQASLTRNEPGSDPVTWAGEASLPLVKLRYEGGVVSVTAVGDEIERGGEGEGVDMPDSGDFSFAARCEPS